MESSDNRESAPDLVALVEELDHAYNKGTPYNFIDAMVEGWPQLAAGIRAQAERIEELGDLVTMQDDLLTRLEQPGPTDGPDKGKSASIETAHALMMENMRMQSALRFYAPPEKYHLKAEAYEQPWADILNDEGATARAVLHEYRGKEGSINADAPAD